MNAEDNKDFRSTNVIDLNSPYFYDQVHKIIEYDLAVLKKNVTTATRLRMTAAEMEVETAALYHAQFWYDLEDLKNLAIDFKEK